MIKKQKIKIIMGTIVKGLGDVQPPAVISVEPSIARQLFINGKAVPVAEKPAKPTTRKKPGKKTTKAKTKK